MLYLLIIKIDRQFSLQKIIKSEINQEVLDLDSSKTCEESDLSIKNIKANSYIFTEVVRKEFNRALGEGNFTCSMKLANVTSAYKKGHQSGKSNYRPVCILTNISIKSLWKMCLQADFTYLNTSAVFGKDIVHIML